jgi:Peptidase family M23/S-layer homology domain
MKHILASILIVFSLTSSTFATTPLPFPTDIYQGKTIKIEIPQYDAKSVSGTFDGKTVDFYEITRVPEWDEVITRAEFLKLLFDNTKFDTTPSATTPAFPDVPEDHEYYDYIRKAQNLGIVHGYEDGTFGPNDPLARSHIAKILVEAFKPDVSTEEIQTFEDVTPDHWHYEYINQAIAAGYFEGYHDGLMRPNRDIVFDEAEIVIRRATNQEELTTITEKDYALAYIGIHRLADIGQKTLIINTDTTNNYTINVLDNIFPTRSFYLEESKTELFGETQQDNTWAMINEAKANPTPEKLWEDEFIVPTEGTITLTFGDTLYINDKFSGSHFGIDYANVEGTPIYASNSGIVTLTDETMSYGNTIVIDHGQNVFTMYLHLSELSVEKDQQVEKGQLIGLMGSTGIATGSHLHFTHFIGDIIVDSKEWYEGSF